MGAVWCAVLLAIWLTVGVDAKPIDVAAGNQLAEDSLDPVQSKVGEWRKGESNINRAQIICNNDGS